VDKKKEKTALLTLLVCLSCTGTAFAATSGHTPADVQAREAAQNHEQVVRMMATPLHWTPIDQGFAEREREEIRQQQVAKLSEDKTFQRAAVVKKKAAVQGSEKAVPVRKAAAQTAKSAVPQERHVAKAAVKPLTVAEAKSAPRTGTRIPAVHVSVQKVSQPARAAAPKAKRRTAKLPRVSAAGQAVGTKRVRVAAYPQPINAQARLPREKRPWQFQTVSDETYRHIEAGIFAMMLQLRTDTSTEAITRFVQILNDNDGLTHLQKIEYLIGFGYAVNHSRLTEAQKRAVIDTVVAVFH